MIRLNKLIETSHQIARIEGHIFRCTNAFQSRIKVNDTYDYPKSEN